MARSYQWTGSQTSDISQMVNAMNAAITAKADGIAVCLVSLTAFNGPTNRALDKGIPVLSYNADAPNNRLAYIGQDLYLSGYNMGQRIVELVGSGDVALFIATPGQLNIQPRIDGSIAAIKKFGKGKIKTTTTPPGALLPDELAKIEAYYLGHKNLKGMFAVDYGSTQGVGQVMQKYGLAKKGVKAGGYDLGPIILKTVQAGHLDFTIDQQPYLQGWLPVLQLFFYKYIVRARRTVGHEHRNRVRDEGQREAVPDDEDALRGQLEQAEVSGHAERLSGAGGHRRPPSTATRRLRSARCAGARSVGARRASCSCCSALDRLLLASHGCVLRVGQRTPHRRVLGADRDHCRRRGDAAHLRRDRPLGRDGLRRSRPGSSTSESQTGVFRSGLR